MHTKNWANYNVSSTGLYFKENIIVNALGHLRPYILSNK